MTIPTKMHPNRGLPATTSPMIASSNSTGSTASSSTTNNMPTPTNSNTADRLAQIDDLKYFLATATENWEDNAAIKRFRLPTGEDMSCVLWNDLFYITGTDIVRSLSFRFHAFGRPVTNAKKFEEGIFSDLRNLKPGSDARLEEPKSELLDMLYKNNCIRTQKKQKVFYWYSVPHDRLFLDALERDLKREKMDMEPTTVAVAEPAASLSLDSTQELFDQLRKSMSLSAAATAHALEDEATRCSTVPHAAQAGYWGWLPHQRNRSANAAIANNKPPASTATTSPIRRSRVNSVPATTTPTTTATTTGSSGRHHYHHLSHAGHAAPPRAPVRPRVRSRATTPSSPTSTSVARRRLSSSLDGVHHHRHVSTTSAYAKVSKPTTTSPKVVPSSLQQQPMARAPGRGDQPTVPVVVNGGGGNGVVARQQQQQQQQFSSDASSPKSSFDSNALKKKKTIFGTLSLFDGSPTYKQRRRRQASTSSATAANSMSNVAAATNSTASPAVAATSVANPRTHHRHQTTVGGDVSPYRVMHPPPHHQSHHRQSLIDPASAAAITGVATGQHQQQPSHHHHHQPATLDTSLTPTQQHYDHHGGNNSSRFVIAAGAAGFVSPTVAAETSVPQQELPAPAWQPVMAAATAPTTEAASKLVEPERTYTCPQPSCGHMFKLLEQLDQHLRAHELEQPFMCAMCGKRFAHPDFLMEHQKMAHNDNTMFDEVMTPATTEGYNSNDCACSSTTTTAPTSWQQTVAAAVAAAAAAAMCNSTTTPPATTHSNSSSDSSRCSTLSPMLDLDSYYNEAASTTTTAGGLPHYAIMRSRTNSSSEADDSASSLTSSPASAIHLNQNQHFYHQPQFISTADDMVVPDSNSHSPFMFNTADRYYARPPVTLFSSYKPELFQQQQQQQQFLSPSAFQYDGSFYHHHQHQQQQDYAPFVAPTDVSMAMM